jgi:pentatricopeptide repeat protein
MVIVFVWLLAYTQHYDLGGPCVDRPSAILSAAIRGARMEGNWDRLIELEKQHVRDGCDIEFRWFGLAESLLEANRPQEALEVLTEMDARGFELNASTMGEYHPRVKEFMQTSLFKTSPAGTRVERLKQAADERRERFDEKLRTIPANERPPENYIARPACPFECCRFGNWSVLKDTELFAAPGSFKVLGRAVQGSRVTALTGEVHLTPQPVVVVSDAFYPKDTIVFVLDYLGEGTNHVRRRRNFGTGDGDSGLLPSALASMLGRVSSSGSSAEAVNVVGEDQAGERSGWVE